MKTNPIKIYLACPIHGADKHFGLRNVVAQNLRGHGYEVVRFFSDLGPAEREGENIYDFDMSRVDESDMVVALLNGPSTGVGMELHEAALRKIPALVLSQHLPHVSGITRDYLDRRFLPATIELPADDHEVPGAVVTAIDYWFTERDRPWRQLVGVSANHRVRALWS